MEKARFVHQKAVPVSEPIFHLPPVVKYLCLANIAAFLTGKIFPELLTNERLYALAFVPARYFGTEPLNMAGLWSPLTHMFLHAGWIHISINVGMLMAFGAATEKALGGRKLLLIYFATGVLGAFTHALVFSTSEGPLIGASGGVSGLFGAALMMLYAQDMLGQGYKKLLPFILVWIGTSLFFGFFGVPGVDNPIAWTTHIGGFIAGLLLYNPVRRLKFY